MADANSKTTADRFGICANSFETDRVFRAGAKAWIAGGTGGEGWYKFEWIAASRSGRQVRKWAPTLRFQNFRAKWIPEHLRDDIWYLVFDTKAEAEAIAAEMEAFASDERAKHPGRRESRQFSTERANAQP